MDCRRNSCWLATSVARSSWRHSEAQEEVQFVPAVVDAVVPVRAFGRERNVVRGKSKPDARARRCDAGIIEVEVDGITIRACRGADATMIASIVQAPRV